MRKITFIVITVFVLAGCVPKKAPQNAAEGKFVDRHMKNVTQLTFDGDNGEAYFSWDDLRLIYQSNRGGQSCDKIWMMNIDGSDKHRVSPGRGAHTCAFFFPGNQKIIFASTSHLPGDCPPRPKRPPGVHFIWPLFHYDIFVAHADGSGMQKITDNPKYDAEPIVSPDGRQIVFGSQRDGDFDIYIMNADGTNVRRLTDTVGYDGGPWFSPDGKRLIFASNMDDWHADIKKFGHNFELYLINLDGTGLERITFNNVFDSFPMFSNQGKKIVFASNRNPQKPRATDIFIAEWID